MNCQSGRCTEKATVEITRTNDNWFGFSCYKPAHIGGIVAEAHSTGMWAVKVQSLNPGGYPGHGPKEFFK